MKNSVNAFEILALKDKLYQRNIRRADGGFFGYKHMCAIVRYFEAEQAAKEITYEAWVQLDGKVYEGFVDIGRDGHLAVRLAH